MTLSFRHTIRITACCCLLGTTWPLAAAEPTIAEQIQGAKSGAEAARIKAIDQLATQGGKAADAGPTLIQLLSDPAAPIRAHAAHALGALGDAAKPAAAAL